MYVLLFLYLFTLKRTFNFIFVYKNTLPVPLRNNVNYSYLNLMYCY